MEKPIRPHERIERPIKPIEPDVRDKKKYPDPPMKTGVNYLKEKIFKTNTDYVADYIKYQKDTEQYKKDFEAWEQFKFIEDIKRSSLSLCMKKYKIVKK